MKGCAFHLMDTSTSLYDGCARAYELVFTGGLTALCREAFLVPLTWGGAEAACGGAFAGVSRPEGGSDAGTWMDQ